MDIEQVLRGLGGAAQTDTVLHLGVSAAQLARALRGRQVWQPGPDVLAVHGAPPAFVQAVCRGGVLTCVSAAGHFGLWQVREPRQLHLALPPRHPILHSRLTRPADGPPVAALADVLIHGLLCLPVPESVVLVESAVNRGLASTDLLRRTLLAGTGGGTASVGCALAALDLIQPGSSSVLQILARVVFRRFGFDVATQVWITGFGVVDFLLEGCLIVELCGPEVDLHKSRFSSVSGQELAATAAGYQLLRVPYTEAMNRPQLMSGRLRRALREGRALAG
ncbi:hypothetical protein [Arthrobacter sp. H14-L1]|uniref:hypothetical protein n=1 Tax=Arthrobacter sp. H14-L1 TaxID=2996697 RepID=UPI00226D5F22|nr:hypothetical protein [Arthrobacter sp. H14-L1]